MKWWLNKISWQGAVDYLLHRGQGIGDTHFVSQGSELTLFLS